MKRLIITLLTLSCAAMGQGYRNEPATERQVQNAVTRALEDAELARERKERAAAKKEAERAELAALAATPSQFTNLELKRHFQGTQVDPRLAAMLDQRCNAATEMRTHKSKGRVFRFGEFANKTVAEAVQIVTSQFQNTLFFEQQRAKRQ